MKKLTALLSTLTLTTLSIAVFSASELEPDPYANPPTAAFEGQTGAPLASSSNIKFEVVASGFLAGSSLTALPNGKIIVAEGPGIVRVIDENGNVSEPISGMPPIRSVGTRSLFDFVVDSNFSENRTVYFTYMAPPPGEEGGEKTFQEANAAAEQGLPFQIPQVAKGVLSEDLSHISNVEVIAEILGRELISSPDGYLYITMQGYGDARSEVQDLTTLTGKVLRINNDGSIPTDNPYAGLPIPRQEIYAVGHRDADGGFMHPQTGELWTIEHGPMGGDELNVIKPGGNAGWPLVTYGKNYDGSEIGPSARTGTEQPLYYWFPSIAPAGLLMYRGDLFPQWQGNVFLGSMSPTEGKFLVRLVMNGETVVAEEHLLVDNDRRVRDLVESSDGAIYIVTDAENNDETNRHFEGQILKLTPQ